MTTRDLPDWFGCYATPAPPLSDVGRVRTPPREQQPIAKAIAAAKAAKRAGFAPTAAVADGVRVEFGMGNGEGAPDPVAASDPYAAAVVKMNARRGGQ